MNTKWKSFVFALTLTALSLVIFPVAAQLEGAKCDDLGIACPEGSGSGGGATVEFISTTLRNVINAALSLTALIAAIFIVYGGFLYLTSAGESDRAERGKKTILYAVIGLLIIGLSAVIVNFVVGAISGGAGGS